MDNLTDSLTIRRFLPDDREMVQEFFDQMGEETVSFFNQNHGNEKRTMSFFDGKKYDPVFWAATVNDGGKELMVGLLFLWDISRTVPWLGIAVRDGWKGLHIGRKLIETAKEYVLENGGGGILLTTAVSNTRGQGLYEHFGFERLGVHPSGEYLYLLRFCDKDKNAKSE